MEVTAEMLARAEGRWHKSSYSGSGAQCVEAAELAEGTLVRDTKNREGGAVVFPRASWLSFSLSFKG
jgi:hypothetical protein